MVKIEEVIEEIKRFAKEFKSQNGDSKLPPNKDMNLWMIRWMVEQDRRITNVEAKTKMLMWFITLGLPVIIFILGCIMKGGI